MALVKKENRQVSHKKIDYCVINRSMDLLLMDLMRLIQTESIGWKKYIFLVVDDFSRFSWVRFLREKSESFEVFNDL